MKKVQVHIPYMVLLERLDDILHAGLNPEIYIDGHSLDNAAPEDLARIREGFADRGLSITLHGPYMDLSPGAGDERIRLATVERFRQVFKVIEHLRPVNVVLHAGYDERRFDGDRRLWLGQSMRTWPEFVRKAERLGTTIAIENIFEEDPQTMKALVEEIGSPFFRTCIDVGHLNLYSRVPFENWFETIGAYVREVHIHDNFGSRDNHLPPGDGVIDFSRFFRLVREYSKDPVYTIEVHGEEGVFKGLEAVKAFL